MRIEIDWTRCDGHGLCAALMPQRIRRDEWGFPLIDSVGLDQRESAAVRRVVAACPALALRIAHDQPQPVARA
ncbi:MAG: ferredoxin [Actinobacteria bacterium]|nr:ferredoxin [Actinomycetota bacterium]